MAGCLANSNASPILGKPCCEKALETNRVDVYSKPAVLDCHLTLVTFIWTGIKLLRLHYCPGVRKATVIDNRVYKLNSWFHIDFRVHLDLGLNYTINYFSCLLLILYAKLQYYKMIIKHWFLSHNLLSTFSAFQVHFVTKWSTQCLFWCLKPLSFTLHHEF